MSSAIRINIHAYIETILRISVHFDFQFLEFVRLRRVSFSQNASEMIKDFFLASRRARNIGYSRAEISKSALQTM